ncbi:transmembrane protein 254 [Gastrophryne carolinensis]
MAAPSRSSSASYFRRANPLLMLIIGLAMAFFAWTVFWPTQVPYERLGPLGSFAQYLVKNHYSSMFYGFWAACLIHVAEAAISLRLCSSKGITDSGARMLWVMQTFLFGIASLSLLLAYKPMKKKR